MGNFVVQALSFKLQDGLKTWSIRVDLGAWTLYELACTHQIVISKHQLPRLIRKASSSRLFWTDRGAHMTFLCRSLFPLFLSFSLSASPIKHHFYFYLSYLMSFGNDKEKKKWNKYSRYCNPTVNCWMIVLKKKKRYSCWWNVFISWSCLIHQLTTHKSQSSNLLRGKFFSKILSWLTVKKTKTNK